MKSCIVVGLFLSMSAFAADNYVAYPWGIEDGQLAIDSNESRGFGESKSAYGSDVLIESFLHFRSDVKLVTNRKERSPKTFITNNMARYGYGPRLPQDYLSVLSKIAPENIIERSGEYNNTVKHLAYPFTGFCVLKIISADELETIVGKEGNIGSIKLNGVRFMGDNDSTDSSRTQNQVFHVSGVIGSYSMLSEVNHTNIDCYFPGQGTMGKESIKENVNKALSGFLEIGEDYSLELHTEYYNQKK